MSVKTIEQDANAFVLKHQGFGLVGNILVGVVGGLIGGLLARLLF